MLVLKQDGSLKRIAHAGTTDSAVFKVMMSPDIDGAIRPCPTDN